MDPLTITEQVDLSNHSTMRLGGKAAYATEVVDREQLAAAFDWANEHKLPLVVVGDGSNIIWRDEGFDGLLVINKISGFTRTPAEDGRMLLTVGAGENWDSVVERSTAEGLTGIEGLSLIPGTAGATPVQNVGAYGQDVSQTIINVEAFDTQIHQFVDIPGNECGFAYRSSRFNDADRGRFLISSITFRLSQGNPQPPFYASLQRYFDEHDVHHYTPQAMREAVMSIRNSKLPDPALVANNGSFFGNPIVDDQIFQDIFANYVDVPHWAAGSDYPGKVKLSAAWLIEQAGFKDYHDETTGMATWPKQPLVLVNEHAKSTADLLAFRQKIVDAVKAKFNVELKQEPELLPKL